MKTTTTVFGRNMTNRKISIEDVEMKYGEE